MDVFLVAILLPMAIVCFFPLLTLIVTFFEKRYVWVLDPYGDVVTSVGKPSGQERSDENPYRAPALESSGPSLTEFAKHTCCELAAIGFEYLGRFRHVKGGIYQLRYDAWISSDRYVLAFVESGALMAIPAKNIIMVTLGEREAVADTLQQTSLLVCFLIQRVQTGYHAGWCRFLDEKHNVWLPTFIGAFRLYFKTYGFLLSRMVYSDRRRLKRRVNLRGTTAANGGSQAETFAN